ncbi:6-pyruvoyl trahydropterin synthase family protein [Maricaulis sp.]|uniref:6-pyruvoyl trahydropterin synthase family protein n=1 Tax=Maricaulis sp. TaxID=1486257 RepID=UPI003A9059C9
MAHLSTKSYGNERGLTCCSRQWAADSHCALLHGYSFGFNFVFAAEQLDKRGWVLDFGKGGFGPIKDWLHDMFDHTILVAEDDPERAVLEALGERGLARVKVVAGTSCERMAEMAFNKASEVVRAATGGRCWVESVECSEHASNSAIYRSATAMTRLVEVERMHDDLADD